MGVLAVLKALLVLPRFEKTNENVASTLDLREEPSECKRPAVRKVLSGIFKAPVWVRDWSAASVCDSCALWCSRMSLGWPANCRWTLRHPLTLCYAHAAAAGSEQAAGYPQPRLRLPSLLEAHERPPGAQATCVSR